MCSGVYLLFFLCNCGVPTVKVKSIEVPPVEMVEALQSKPTARVYSNSDTNKSYLFLEEDVLSSTFTREVYTIKGFNYTRNDSFSAIVMIFPLSTKRSPVTTLIEGYFSCNALVAPNHVVA